MSDYYDNPDHIEQAILKIRKKQALCIHPSYKCSCCGLYKDNVQNTYVQEISRLKNVIMLIGVQMKDDLKDKHDSHLQTLFNFFRDEQEEVQIENVQTSPSEDENTTKSDSQEDDTTQGS